MIIIWLNGDKNRQTLVLIGKLSLIFCFVLNCSCQIFANITLLFGSIIKLGIKIMEFHSVQISPDATVSRKQARHLKIQPSAFPLQQRTRVKRPARQMSGVWWPFINQQMRHAHFTTWRLCRWRHHCNPSLAWCCYSGSHCLVGGHICSETMRFSKDCLDPKWKLFMVYSDSCINVFHSVIMVNLIYF